MYEELSCLVAPSLLTVAYMVLHLLISTGAAVCSQASELADSVTQCGAYFCTLIDLSVTILPSPLPLLRDV